MATPTLRTLHPDTGPSAGGDLVRLVGTGFSPHVQITFGGRPGAVVGVHEEAGESIADVRTPASDPGVVELTLTNLDAAGAPVPGERATVFGGYRFVRAQLVVESNLTRLVRKLLQDLKQQLLANVSASVSVDYDDTSADGLNVVAIAKLPSLVLSGPSLRENRFYSTNLALEEPVAGEHGPELQRRKPPLTVDLSFTLTAAAARTAELLNMMAAVASYVARNRWIELVRDPAAPSRGTVRWVLEPDGEVRTQLQAPNDARVFTWGLVVKGFDVDEGLPRDRGRPVTGIELHIDPLVGENHGR